MRTISPGSISRMYSAPSASKAQRFAGHAILPAGVLPITSGRTPQDRGTASMRSGNKNSRLNDPCKCLSTCGSGSCLLDMRWLGQQVNDDFRVGRALENVPVFFVFLAQQSGVDQIAVVRHRNGAQQILPQQRLGVA